MRHASGLWPGLAAALVIVCVLLLGKPESVLAQDVPVAPARGLDGDA